MVVGRYPYAKGAARRFKDATPGFRPGQDRA